MSKLIGGLKAYRASPTPANIFNISDIANNLIAGNQWANQLPPDPYAANVVFWLGIDGSTLSDKTGSCTVTTPGSGTTVADNKVTLTGASCVLATHSSLIMNTGAFCYEMLFKHSTSSPNSQCLVDTRGTDNVNGISYYYGTPPTLITYPVSNGGMVSSLNTTEVIHYAVTRDGSGNIKQFVRGVQVGPTLNTTSDFSSTQAYFGQNGQYSGYFLTGEIHGIKVTKGVPRYTANFTPPEIL